MTKWHKLAEARLKRDRLLYKSLFTKENNMHGPSTINALNRQATAKADKLKELAQDVVDNGWRYADAQTQIEVLLTHILGEGNA